MTLTLQAEFAEPYVYLDNRALVLSNGPHGLIFHRAQGRWLAETLTIIAEEQRATDPSTPPVRRLRGGG